jgi:eukaryotic-like serine/threonine-protein kinase
VLSLIAGSAAGCGVAHRSVAPTRPQEPAAPASLVRVVVFDGDLRRRVPSATVWIGHRRLRADRRGVARIRLVPGPAVVRVRVRGYAPSVRRWNFNRFPIFTFRVYQPRLQWTMYGGNPQRTQVHQSIRLRPPYRIIWSLANQNLIEFPAVVSDGFAYIATQLGTVRAISMRYGTVAWRRELHATMAASLAIWGDKLVVHDMNGHVRILDRANGRTIWDHYVGSPIESSPVVQADVDYFGTWDGRVIAIDLRRRRVRWSDAFGAKITASVSLAGNTAYLGNYAGRVLALDARTGRVRWSGSVNGRVYGTSPVSSGRLFVPSSDGDSVTAFSTRGAKLWSINTGSYVYSSPAVWAGRVVFGSYNGVLYCVSAANGSRLWTVPVGGSISGAPIVVSGVVYAASFGNRTVGVNVRTGHVIFRFPHGEYVPVSGNGGRLLLHGYSRIWAVEPRRR